MGDKRIGLVLCIGAAALAAMSLLASAGWYPGIGFLDNLMSALYMDAWGLAVPTRYILAGAIGIAAYGILVARGVLSVSSLRKGCRALYLKVEKALAPEHLRNKK